MTDPTPEQTADRRRHYSRGNPIRNLRLDDPTWEAINRRAEQQGVTASDVIRAAVLRDLETPA
jgi:hypothetical protein